jgi:indolepyruvate ferredoxin oxidoreductase
MSTADFVRHRDANLKVDARLAAIGNVVGAENLATLDANSVAEKLLGNSIFANVLLLGCAWQRGLVPVSLAALKRAIELNGVEIDKNQQAFSWGRIAASDPDYIEKLMQDDQAPSDDETLDAVIKRRSEFLVDYQDEALAARYSQLVVRVRDAEADQGGDGRLAEAVARSYFKLLSYKDEYEVARLHTQTGFLETLRRDFGASAKIKFHLAPPLLSRKLDARGRPRKKEFGSWILPLMRVLASMRRLRGSKLDVFGMTAERRLERSLIVEFENLIDTILPSLNRDNLDQARHIVALIMDIRGYGPVKETAIDDVRRRIATDLQDYLNVRQQAA